ncbi:DUF4097 family beta strand repeat-containing protein [Paenibacillus agilis]|uniref:DUF4097 family beta strand repeat protein n=1 Tax=Paenibacillus agilis TaxID=3020863 RepID=A0A559IK70_9BACL|nr:DUF1700 domain-containing protein [Paenibacillus agilis]TVX88055.1 DUF4097 family beta strand repeat protein [Paenibacillus agilis]
MMNKQEYLALLRFYSQQLAPEVQSDLISEVEAHFIYGEQQGKTEEQIAEELGDPIEMAKETVGPTYKAPDLSAFQEMNRTDDEPRHYSYSYSNNYSSYSAEEYPPQNLGQPKAKKSLLALLSAFTLIVVGGGLLVSIGIDRFIDGPNEKVVASSTVESILEDVDKQFEKLEDLEDIVEASTTFAWDEENYDFEGSNYEGVIHMGNSPAWKDLIIDTDLGQVDIQFKQGDRNEIAWKAFTAPSVGELMEATQLKNEQIIFELDESGMYDNYRYSFVVTLQDDFELRKLQLEQELGDINLKGGKFEKIELQMDNGILRASDIVSGSMNVELDNGSTEFERIASPIKLESDNGEIKILESTHPVNIKLDLGSVDLGMKQPHDVDVKSDMGAIQIEVPQGAKGKYEAKSGLGDVKVPVSDDNGTFRVSAKTDAGTIIIKE